MQKLPKLNSFVKEILRPLIVNTSTLGSVIAFLKNSPERSKKQQQAIDTNTTELRFLQKHIKDVVKVALQSEIEKERKTAAEHLEDGECQHNITDEFVKLVLHREIFGDKEIFGENEENYTIWTADWYEEMQKRRQEASHNEKGFKLWAD